MYRRTFLSHITALASASVCSQAWAAPGNGRVLLVFLRGGYDAASLLVPLKNDFYRESRPNIAISTPLPLDAQWGLHPILKDSLLPLYQRGELAFVPFAGTHDLSRSHFETQDSIELGQPLEGRRDYNSGFLNRLTAEVDAHAGIAFTDGLPLICKGEASIPNLPLKQGKPGKGDDRVAGLMQQMYAGHRLQGAVQEGIQLRQEVGREMQKEEDADMAANRQAVSAKGFELEARRMALLLRDRYRIGFVDVGGWDTHTQQGAEQGTLAGNLDTVGKGLAAFANAMGPAWKNTVVVVISEFGRTFRENGSRGTDHGHGSVYWLLGGGIKGGRIAGEQVAVSAANLFQNRDYPVLNDYRAVLGDVFGGVFGLSGVALNRVFPGMGKSGRLGVV